MDEFDVLAAIHERDRQALLDRAVPRRLSQGDRLYLAGDRARRVHLVRSGIMKLVARGVEGAETILCLAVPGEPLGEVAAVDELPQPLDAVAATPAHLLGVDADHFVEAVFRSPAAARELAVLTARRQRWLCDTAVERSSAEVPARLAGRLLDLADLLGRVEDGAIAVDMPVSQSDLGRLSGMCRESACKTLRRFKRMGLVDYRGRRMRILQPAGLERIRCGGRAR